MQVMKVLRGCDWKRAQGYFGVNKTLSPNCKNILEKHREGQTQRVTRSEVKAIKLAEAKSKMSEGTFITHSTNARGSQEVALLCPRGDPTLNTEET